MYVKVYATPGARKERVTRVDSVTFRIDVKEPAERNMANDRIRALLSETLGLTKGDIRLVTGHRSSSKIFDVALRA